MIAQGEIWWADLGDPLGSAPGYHRPVLVIQSDSLNRSRLATALCAPLTSNPKWATAPGNVSLRAEDTGLDRDSVANCAQLVTLDKEQFVERAGRISERRLLAVFAAIDVALGR